MKLAHGTVARGLGWTVGAFALIQTMRFAISIILTRLLAPEIFGVVLIVNSLRTGIDLFLDVGIGQSIIQNKYGDRPSFYNTAWSIQIIRGILIWVVCIIISAPLAKLYEAPELALLLPVAGIYFLLTGFSSTAPFLLRRNLQLAKLNGLEMAVVAVFGVIQIALAYLYPNVWSLIIGSLVSAGLWMIGTYLILPDMRHRICFSRRHAKNILRFGKWIFISSIIYFLSLNFDRLSLGNLVPFAVLGVYGLARTFAELLTSLFIRLGDFIVFPVVASATESARSQFRSTVASARLSFLLIVVLGVSLFCATADLFVNVLFDSRYHQAGALLSVLVIGTWFSILCAINEATLLGFGKPLYGAAANGVKLIYLVIGIPFSFKHFGIVGVAALVAGSDVCRYVPLLVGQAKEDFSFAAQDTWLTVSLFALIGLWEFLRWQLGFETSFQALL